jgi:cytochrome c-type protein NapB
MVVAVLALGLATGDPGSEGSRLPVHPPQPTPIPAEADVFRLDPSATTIAMDAERRRDAKVRDLASYRALRAYPGAPPAIPHDVDPSWLRTQACNTCHARGGWAPAFGAYTPLTPHPQYANCMQCHVDGAEGSLFVDNDFVPAAWPELDQQALTWDPTDADDLGSSPPPMPHALQLRGNCLACHSGPAAVAEIRTSHPERANCRQCHAARDDVGAARGESAGGAAGVFTREVR